MPTQRPPLAADPLVQIMAMRALRVHKRGLLGVMVTPATIGRFLRRQLQRRKGNLDEKTAAEYLEAMFLLVDEAEQQNEPEPLILAAWFEAELARIRALPDNDPKKGPRPFFQAVWHTVRHFKLKPEPRTPALMSVTVSRINLARTRLFALRGESLPPREPPSASTKPAHTLRRSKPRKAK